MKSAKEKYPHRLYISKQAHQKLKVAAAVSQTPMWQFASAILLEYLEDKLALSSKTNE